MAIPVRLDRSVPDGDKHAKAPGGLVILVVSPSTRSLLHVRRRFRPSSHPSGQRQLTERMLCHDRTDQ